ncbi:MAG: retropepsin-like aspartic protease [Tsuneonella suprasediminis]|nr:retroviral-like aspartic protease family protein [Altererythrobacter sp. N1]
MIATLLLTVAASGLGLGTTLPPAPPPAAVSDAALPGAPAPTTDIPISPTADSVVLNSEQDRYLRMTVPVTIEGFGPFRFMVDTGAQATVVTPELRDRLQLRSLGVATVIGMASIRQVELVQLDGLEFAERVFDALRTPLLENRHIGADGIIGLDSLQDLRVLLDFRDDTIAVDDANALGGNSGYEIVVRARNKLGRMIITNAVVDGVRTALIVDTGAQWSIGNAALQSRLRTRGQTDVTANDVNGASIAGKLSLAHNVVIDRMQLHSMPIAFADAPAFAALGYGDKPALILGMESLRLFDRVAIDFAQRKVLFDMPTGSMRDNRMRPG